MSLKIFTTGGTIDKIYFDANSAFSVGNSLIDELLNEANIKFPYEYVPLLSKDSLELTDEDRQLVRESVENCSASEILITHGTDTMVDTAKVLRGIEGKTIVFTGSMQPARLRHSDAIFNIGYAIAATQLLDAGVYIAMNGQVFDPLRTKKNLREQRFEAL